MVINRLWKPGKCKYWIQTVLVWALGIWSWSTTTRTRFSLRYKSYSTLDRYLWSSFWWKFHTYCNWWLTITASAELDKSGELCVTCLFWWPCSPSDLPHYPVLCSAQSLTCPLFGCISNLWASKTWCVYITSLQWPSANNAPNATYSFWLFLGRRKTRQRKGHVPILSGCLLNLNISHIEGLHILSYVGNTSNLIASVQKRTACAILWTKQTHNGFPNYQSPFSELWYMDRVQKNCTVLARTSKKCTASP